MSALKHYTETLAVETFSIVLGIVLALGANAWHDRRVHEAEASEALTTIRAELATNDSMLHAKLPYHGAMRDSLTALVARTHKREVAGGQLAIKNWNGLQPSQLLDDAWQTARSTQAVQYMPYHLIVGLSRTYAVQQRIGDVNRAFFGAVYTPGFATGGVAALSAMGSYLADLAATEAHLEQQYQAELARVDSSLRGPSR